MPDLIRLLRALPGAVLILLAFAATPAVAADPMPKFSHYPVEDAYAGPIAAPKIDPKTNPEVLRAYREAVAWAESNGKKLEVDAAGRYVRLKESCGASCALGHLLDAQTGRIIRLPVTISGWRETEDEFDPVVTRAHSRLIVLRGMRNEEGINGVHYYTIEANGRLRHLRSDDTDGNFEKPLVVD